MNLINSPPSATASGDDKSRLSVLEVWPKFAGIVTGGTIVTSILYNWAYFTTVDPSAIQFLTIGDHISSALEWLPTTVIMYGINIILDLTSKSVFPPRRQLLRLPSKKFSRALVKYGGLGAVVALFLASWILVPQSAWTPAIGVCSVTFMILVGVKSFRGDWSSTQLLITSMVAAALISSALQKGNQRAYKDFTDAAGNATVRLVDQAQIDDAIVLRHLERGILLRQPKTGAVIFIPWARVNQLVETDSSVETRSLVCQAFDVLCWHYGRPRT